jgi:16S rRNA C967 or C1407 C5-methylase (RsmB/RsmF family)
MGLRRDVQVGAVEEMWLLEGVEELKEMIAVAEDVHQEVAEGEVVVEEEAAAAAVVVVDVEVEVHVVDVKECVERVMDC